MALNVYQRLAYHLDQLPGGYPSTSDGVEIRLLKRLFTPEDAELTLHLTPLPENARVIAYRAGIPVPEVERHLQELAQKGCIMSVPTKTAVEYIFPRIPAWLKRWFLIPHDADDDQMLYLAYQFVIGIWEFHLHDLDPEFIKEMNIYMPYLIKNWVQAPQLRTIPIGKSLTPELKIMAYEKAGELLKKQKKFAVADCICRKEMQIMGHGCNKPLESCLVFGMAADYYVRNGLGRSIDYDEALKILNKAEKSGLVLQPSNAKEIDNICCCCGCCCGVLRNLKTLPEPGKVIPSAFRVQADSEKCDGCEACVRRCPMDAIILKDQKVFLNPNRCIGCGVCVSACPVDALSLVRKPEHEQPFISADVLQNQFKILRKRGKTGPLKSTALIFNSIFDRFAAPRN